MGTFCINWIFFFKIQLSRLIQKDNVQIETMPDMAYVSIFMDNDLTHITEDHFEIKLIARLLDQMYVIQLPMFPPSYDDTLPSAPQFPEHLHSLLTCS